ncbi:uncharacterized protein LOC143289967 [Babylonia areolata]|uniref:uncharacterized protein LOC143289967 n=1 Tax=Babylonia areolata TaxID=304850 RepID=UPI003FD26E5B
MTSTNWPRRTDPRGPILGLLLILAGFTVYRSLLLLCPQSHPIVYERQSADSPPNCHPDHGGRFGIGNRTFTELRLEGLEVLLSRGPKGWFRVNCDQNKQLRKVSISASAGNLSFYIYNTASEDSSATKRAIGGWYFEQDEIAKFLSVSGHLPLIDVGANLGLVALQAAMQRRQVVALEPINQNAIRLCRSVLDFGHAPLVQVIRNAVSSEEGNVTLAMASPAGRTRYEVTRTKTWGYEPTNAYAIHLDRLLEILPFKRAALKIDVESHEGHVLAGAEQLFQEVDIPLVWMEWIHVKNKPNYGGVFIIQFMRKLDMVPFNLMTGEQLSMDSFLQWPFSVLWKRATHD